MSWKSDEQLVSSMQQELKENEEELRSLQVISRNIDALVEEVEADTRRQIQELEQVPNFWQGPEADRYITRSIEEAQISQREFYNIAERYKDECQTQAEHLSRNQEMLEKDIAQIENSSSVNDGGEYKYGNSTNN